MGTRQPHHFDGPLLHLWNGDVHDRFMWFLSELFDSVLRILWKKAPLNFARRSTARVLVLTNLTASTVSSRIGRIGWCTRSRCQPHRLDCLFQNWENRLVHSFTGPTSPLRRSLPDFEALAPTRRSAAEPTPPGYSALLQTHVPSCLFCVPVVPLLFCLCLCQQGTVFVEFQQCVPNSSLLNFKISIPDHFIDMFSCLFANVFQIPHPVAKNSCLCCV